MLLVNTDLRPSGLHGVGLFNTERIAKGQITWEFKSNFDMRWTREEILSFPKEFQVFLHRYCWKSKVSGLYCVSMDGAKYINHSTHLTNLGFDPHCGLEGCSYALRDIEPGTELIHNYVDFDEIEVGTDTVWAQIQRKWPELSLDEFRYWENLDRIAYGTRQRRLENEIKKIRKYIKRLDIEEQAEFWEELNLFKRLGIESRTADHVANNDGPEPDAAAPTGGK